jgi:hypothetical protein
MNYQHESEEAREPRARHRDRLADLFHGQPDAVVTVSRRGWIREAYAITPI